MFSQITQLRHPNPQLRHPNPLEIYMLKAKVACVLIFGFLNGCNAATVPDIYNRAIKDFYEEYSFDDPEVKGFAVDGKLVAPYFRPTLAKSYTAFDLGISLFTKQESATVVLLKVSIAGMGSIFDSRATMIASGTEPNGIFFEHRILVEEVDVSKFEEIADQNRELKVTVTLLDNDVEHVIEYLFVLGIKRIAAPFH